MPPVVVLDACVLYPAAQRDLFMWLVSAGAIRAHWTNEIHDEWTRNVEHDYGIGRNVLRRVRKLMDHAAVGVKIENPDGFLCRLLADSPKDVVEAFLRMRDNLKNPTKTTGECAGTTSREAFTSY